MSRKKPAQKIKIRDGNAERRKIMAKMIRIHKQAGQKKDAIRISKEQFNSISEAVNIPIVAIGGITYDNILQLKEYKTHGIAVISAIFSGDILDNSIHLRKRSELLFGN